MRCFRPFDGLNVRTLRAVISMLSPVWGFRPRRDALWRIRKWPNPTIFTSSPFSKHPKMMSNTDSTTDAAWRLDNPCAETELTRSFLVTAMAHLLPEPRIAGPSPRGDRSRRAPPQEGLVALGLELSQHGSGRSGVGEAPHADAVEGGTVDAGRSRPGRRGGHAACPPHLHLQAIARQVSRQGH